MEVLDVRHVTPGEAEPGGERVPDLPRNFPGSGTHYSRGDGRGVTRMAALDTGAVVAG